MIPVMMCWGRQSFESLINLNVHGVGEGGMPPVPPRGSATVSRDLDKIGCFLNLENVKPCFVFGASLKLDGRYKDF